MKRIIIAQSSEIPAAIESLIVTGDVICTSDLTDEQSDALIAKLLADVESANTAE
jgi:hypothetical protein